MQMNDTTVDCYANDAESSRDYMLITIYTTLMSITIGGNLLVIIAFATDAALRAIANYWIVSLSLTDIFVSITAMPLQVCAHVTHTLCVGQLWQLYHYNRWTLGERVCDMFIVFDVLSCTCSIYHLLLISLDRYLCVRFPVQYPRARSGPRALAAIACVWLFCICLATPRLFKWKVIRVPHVFHTQPARGRTNHPIAIAYSVTSRT
jgi:hypothetical protein